MLAWICLYPQTRWFAKSGFLRLSEWYVWLMGASQLKIVIEHSGFRTSHFKLIIALLWLYAAEMYVECSFDIVDKNIAEKNIFCVSAHVIPNLKYVLCITEHYWCLHKCSYYQWHVRSCSPIISLMLALSCVLIMYWMDEYSKSKIVCLHNGLVSYLYLWASVQVEGTASSKGLLGSPLKIWWGSQPVTKYYSYTSKGTNWDGSGIWLGCLLGTSSRGVLGMLYQKDPGADPRDLLAWESLSVPPWKS